MTILTYFAASLSCQHCAEATLDAQVQSPLLGRWVNDQRGVDTLRIGERFDVSDGDFEAAYIKARAPELGEPTRLLETWSCPTCRQLNWVVVEIVAQCVDAVVTAPLSRQTLQRAHFVTDAIYEEAFQPLLGESLWVDGEVRPDFIDALAAKLSQ